MLLPTLRVSYPPPRQTFREKEAPGGCLTRASGLGEVPPAWEEGCQQLPLPATADEAPLGGRRCRRVRQDERTARPATGQKTEKK